MTANSPSDQIGATESFGPFGLIGAPSSSLTIDSQTTKETSKDKPAHMKEQWTHETKNSDVKPALRMQKIIVFFTQVILLYGLVTASLVNLALEPEGRNRDLWSALLFSAIGYLLPSPTLKLSKHHPSALPASK